MRNRNNILAFAPFMVVLTLLMLGGMSPLCAQKPDTLYIYETVTEHDTLFSRDTTWVHDTLYLRQNLQQREVREDADSLARIFHDGSATIESKQVKEKRHREPREKRERAPMPYFRHEFKLELCDPTGVALFDRYFVFVVPVGFDLDLDLNKGLLSPWFHATPVFAAAYHFRATKWLWIGLHTQYVHYEDLEIGDITQTVPGICDRRYHAVSIMPELRFSWFNRPHVTLYSELSFGVTKFIGRVTNYDLSYADNSTTYFDINPNSNTNNKTSRTLFFSPHVTLFGIRAGGDHWFGSFELGVGFKGFGAIGVGYGF